MTFPRRSNQARVKGVGDTRCHVPGCKRAGARRAYRVNPKTYGLIEPQIVCGPHRRELGLTLGYPGGDEKQ